MADNMTIRELIDESVLHSCNLSITAISDGRIGGPCLEMRISKDNYTVMRRMQSGEINAASVDIVAWNFEAMIVTIEDELQKRGTTTQEDKN